jgi:hypothetical protein
MEKKRQAVRGTDERSRPLKQSRQDEPQRAGFDLRDMMNKRKRETPAAEKPQSEEEKKEGSATAEARHVNRIREAKGLPAAIAALGKGGARGGKGGVVFGRLAAAKKAHAEGQKALTKQPDAATVQQKPAAKTAPSEQKPAVKTALSEQKPAAKTVHSEQKPAAKTVHSEQKPAAKPAPSEQKPAAKPATIQQRPAAKTVHSRLAKGPVAGAEGFRGRGQQGTKGDSAAQPNLTKVDATKQSEAAKKEAEAKKTQEGEEMKKQERADAAADAKKKTEAAAAAKKEEEAAKKAKEAAAAKKEEAAAAKKKKEEAAAAATEKAEAAAAKEEEATAAAAKKQEAEANPKSPKAIDTLDIKAVKKMTVPKLRTALEQRGLSTEGLKGVLLQRLSDHVTKL